MSGCTNSLLLAVLFRREKISPIRYEEQSSFTSCKERSLPIARA